MPRYDFYCSKCNSTVEIYLNINDASKEQSCGICKNILTKIFNSVSAIFNGSGFYSTDNRKIK